MAHTMNLHTHTKDFSALITFTAAHLNITPAFVEKDYWITLILSRLANSANVGNAVFKGGTSLSKGYRLISRFSEDIDLAMINENLSGNALKTKIRSIALAAKIRHFYDLYYLANDSECVTYIQTANFKTDFDELLAHDKQAFDTPANWQDKSISQSPLVTDFPLLWNELRETYQKELPKLAFIPVPDEKEVAATFIEIVEQVK
ncbi:MAG: nucleotidyl transferase AbiEii/AbiGii toxin family protein [Candidatus Symbiothrix sp.]|jgi:predicted nucleotidyltransferase component of viral defense system|nr:nucleotidyl transferase AbiEii/AbiGii toxin family protein [Candidatus Symbiothrix sp.]